jgi:hypothetical protein
MATPKMSPIIETSKRRAFTSGRACDTFAGEPPRVLGLEPLRAQTYARRASPTVASMRLQGLSLTVGISAAVNIVSIQLRGGRKWQPD